MLIIKIVRTFPMGTFVSEIIKFQKRLFWFSNFPGAAILNNCDVSWLPYFFFKQKLFVQIPKSNHNMSQLFKMAAPRKFENQNKRFWNSFILDTKDSIGKRLNNFNFKH